MTQATEQDDGQPSRVAQWIGVLLPPGAWLLQLQVGYMLARGMCHHPLTRTFWHVTALATVTATVFGAFIAWRDWTRTNQPLAGSDTVGRERAELLSTLGVMLGSLFTLVIIAQWTAKFFIDPCEY